MLRAPAALDPEPPLDGLRYRGGQPERITGARRRVLELVGEHFDGEDYLAWTRSGLAHAAGVSASVIDGLTKQELFEPVKIPASAVVAAPDLQPASHRLSDEQTVAAEALVAEAQTGEFSCTLLDGVTGSGKTEVYF